MDLVVYVGLMLPILMIPTPRKKSHGVFSAVLLSRSQRCRRGTSIPQRRVEYQQLRGESHSPFLERLFPKQTLDPLHSNLQLL